MVIIFEGCRSSGKTFLSNKVSDFLSIDRYKFDFVGYFSSIGLDSKNSLPAHMFAVGKELMLMQMNRDGFIKEPIIVDRGFLTVLAWGISEKRITKEEALSQLDLMIEKDLLNGVSVIYIKKRSDVIVDRGPKDQWDSTEKNNQEIEAYSFLIEHIKSKNIKGLLFFEIENDFKDTTINNTINCVKNVRNSSK